MKQIYLVRHGQTLLNKFNKMQGWIDSPLTTKGEQQADLAGEKLQNVSFDLAVSSDMLRTQNTLKHILKNHPSASHLTPTINPDFREIYFGSFEGVDATMTWNQIGGPHGSFNQNDLIKQYGLLAIRDFMNEADPFHEAETADQVATRIQKAITSVKDQLADGQTALVVSHGTYIRNIATYYSDGQYLSQPDNASITVLDVTNTPKLISYNQ